MSPVRNKNQFETPKFSVFCRRVKVCNPEVDVEMLRKGYDMCLMSHVGQFRDSGEPFVNHPIAVAELVAKMGMDDVSIVTALLHDAIEDTSLTLEQVENTFSPTVAWLVDGVTNLRKIKLQPKHVQQSENFRKLFIALSKDFRVIVVKLCDRLHNMQTISYKQEEKQRAKAIETLEIYVPLAERLGMYNLRDSLSDLSFQVINPIAYESVFTKLKNLETKYNRAIKTKNVILTVEEVLRGIMQKNNIECTIEGRKKNSYSIWKKLVSKKIDFNQLCDVMAFRVITKNIDDCYRALGVIHQSYYATPGDFTDYISTPKSNGYQSIHTVILGPFEQKIEIQIRTEEMHEQALHGLAAHWSYKQSKRALNDSEEIAKKSMSWITKVLDIVDKNDSAEEFMRVAKLAMYEKEITTFTKTGDIVNLPQNATIIDFAFAISEEVGLHCYNGQIDGKVVDCFYQLSDGDQVEIVTSADIRCNKEWLKHCVTAIARRTVSRFLEKIV